MVYTSYQRKHLFTPLRYPGGKTSLFEFFAHIIQQHGWKNSVYIEPYAGGAGAALSLLLLEKIDSIVINDFDPAIYAFWRAILNDTEAFIDKVENTPVTIEEWESQRKIYKDKDKSNPLSLGFATFFLNRTNRSGILTGAGPIGGKSQSGQWKIDARYNKSALVEKIRLIAAYKDRIKATNEDGVALIKKYYQRPEVFFYIDPPYFVKGADLYLNAFKYEDHKKLANTLNKYADAKWVLTYDNEEAIRELYPSRKQEPFSLKYSMHQDSKVGSEIMIFSDAIEMSLLR